MLGGPEHSSLAGPKPAFEYGFSNWDRRCGIDRRRGRRRIRDQRVLFDLRLNSDRRQLEKRTVPGPILPQPIGRYRAVAAILQPTLMRRSSTAEVKHRDHTRFPAQYLVTVREGLAASAYACWERAAQQPDGSVYRQMAGAFYRQIGTALQQLDDLADADRAEEEYEREYQRAYQVIYSQHPELRGRGEECLGEVTVRSGGLET